MPGLSNRVRSWCAALALLAGAGALAGCSASPEERRARVEAEILSNPESRAIFEVIKRAYPEDFAQLVDQVLAAPAYSDEAALQALSMRWFQGFLMRIGPDIARAPDAALHRLAKDYAGMLAYLQRTNVDGCAAMSTGGLFDARAAGARVQARLIRFNGSLIEVAAEGRASKVERVEPSDRDWVALEGAVVADGAGDTVMQALYADSVASLPVAEQCTTGVHLYRGLASLPEAQAARLGAAMLAPNPQAR